jgi:hypothetical protein
MLNKGDKVRIVPGQVTDHIAKVCEGKVGTIVSASVVGWDYLVYFKGTDRPTGIFGMDHDMVSKIEMSVWTSHCKTRTQSHLIHTPHGVQKVTTQTDVEN